MKTLTARGYKNVFSSSHEELWSKVFGELSLSEVAVSMDHRNNGVDKRIFVNVSSIEDGMGLFSAVAMNEDELADILDKAETFAKATV